MTRTEQETIFRFAADENVVSAFTAQPSTARKLERAGYTAHKVSTRGGRPVGWFFKVPLVEFRWRVGVRKRVLSEAQRRVLTEKLHRPRLVMA